MVVLLTVRAKCSLLLFLALVLSGQKNGQRSGDARGRVQVNTAGNKNSHELCLSARGRRLFRRSYSDLVNRRIETRQNHQNRKDSFGFW